MDENTGSGPTAASMFWVLDRLSEMMERHGVQKREQVARIAQILGVGRQQVRRKFEHPDRLTVIELQRLCADFDESLGSLFGGRSAKNMAPPAAGAGAEQADRAASFVADNGRLACRIREGLPQHNAAAQVLVCSPTTSGDWLVGSPSAMDMHAPGLPRLGVERLTMVQESSSMRIAVLDDDRDAADGLVEWFRLGGYEACAFRSADALEKELAMGFDGYVLDVVLKGSGPQRPYDLVRKIREEQPDVAIVLLTGHYRDGVAGSTELADVIQQHRVRVLEKPALPALLLGELLNASTFRTHSAT